MVAWQSWFQKGYVMRIFLVLCLITVFAAFAGCESQPARTTVDVDQPPATVIERPAAPANTGVDVQVGGGKGVDVNVNPPANPESPNP
jgi:hypothetical protein